MTKYDLFGKRFGKLTVLERLPANSHGEAIWVCRCDCGNTHLATSYNLTRGKTKQCRECMIKQIADTNRTHGCQPKRLHEIYSNMKTRCHNPKYELWHRYGGRGIKICDEWEKSFESFRDWAFSSGYSEELTLDRINNDGDYCPENCKWSTVTEQANNRRTNRMLTLHGETDTMANWSRRLNLPYWLIQKRVDNYKWSDEKALTEPRRKYGTSGRHKE